MADTPKGFTNRYLCRACVQRSGVESDGDTFIVCCRDEYVPAVLRAECYCFKDCSRHKTHLGRPPVSSEKLRAIHAYAVSLGEIDPVEKVAMVAAFEAELVAKA